MKKKKLLLVFISGIIITGFAVAADYSGWFGNRSDEELPEAKEEYRKLWEKFMQRDTVIHLSGTLRLFDGKNRSVVKETNSLRFTRKGNQYYARFDYLETFCDGQYIVQLDTVERLIVVGKIGDQQALASAGTTQALDMVFSDTAVFKTTGAVVQQGRIRKLSLKSDIHPRIRLYTINYDTQTYRMRNVEIEWWKDEWRIDETDASDVWVTVMDYEYLPWTELNMKETIGKIIRVSEDSAELQGRYKEFRLYVTF
jgi:hypothetical protein